MNRYSTIVNQSRFGMRRIVPVIENTSSIQLQTLNVTSINGVSVKETEQENVQQKTDIDTSKTDIITLQSQVLMLEATTYRLQQIVYNLSGSI